MNEVDAVRNKDQLAAVAVLLEKHHGQQMVDVWNFGLQVALRVSDLLSIRMDDIVNGELVLREGKTGKEARIPLNNKAMSIVERVQDHYPDSVYLFQSRSARNLKGAVKPLSREYVARRFKEVGEIVGVRLGTHSMRKTRGYHLYKKSHDIGAVMKLLRHSSQAETLRYIGITAEDTANNYMEEL